MFRKITLFSLLFGVFFVLSSAVAQRPVTGKPAQPFMLSTPDGHRLALADISGKGTVVLVVLRGYPGYQCPYCVKQVHDFVENAGKFAALNAQVLLVYPGPSANLDQHAREFLTKQNPLPSNVHLVVDPDYTLTNTYGLRWDAPNETAYPSTFLIDRKGIVFFIKVSTGHGERTTAADILNALQKQSS